MRVKAKYSVKQFRSRKKTEEDIDAIVRRGFQLATRKFIEQVDDRVPVVTGMAKGAFGKLARYSGAKLDLSGAKPGQGITDDGTLVWKDRKLGEQQATQPPFLTHRAGRYSFSFNSRVAHYLLRDFNYVPTKEGTRTPWKSFEYGSQAFTARLEQYLRRNLSKVLIPTVRLTSEGVVSEQFVNLTRQESPF